MERSTTDWLRELLRHPTTTDQSNLPLIDVAEQHLAAHGASCNRSYSDCGTKANLLATFGDAARRGLVLSGHTDVVPPGEGWHSDPFAVNIRDGRAYGRGACDMKGFLAVLLSLAPDFQAAAKDKTIHIAMSYDEEIGCVGVRRLLPLIERLPVKPFGCIVGEPTGMRLVTAHKGKTSCRVDVAGRSGHSSDPDRGVNAISFAAAIIIALERHDAELARSMKPGAFCPNRDTINVGRISGGTAMNVIPGRCSFDVEMRYLPEPRANPDLELLIRRLGAASGAAEHVAVTELSSYPGLFPQQDAPFIALMRCESGDGEAVSFGTEAGFFSRLGIPTVVLGPGSIQQAHQPDEFIELAQLELCRMRLRKLLAGPLQPCV